MRGRIFLSCEIPALLLFLGLSGCAGPNLSKTFGTTGSLNTPRGNHTATLLNDGTVLIVGGDDGGTAERFNPNKGTFTYVGRLNTPRLLHTATLLQDGTVLIAGGYSYDRGANSFNFCATAELYDPATRTFSYTGNLNSARYSHVATLLKDGTVLITGNEFDVGDTPHTAEIYDPPSRTFTAIPQTDISSGDTQTVLGDGSVLIAGGTAHTIWGFPPIVYSLIFSPATKAFTYTGSLNYERSWHKATLLNDGRVLITGGNSSRMIPTLGAEMRGPIQRAELYDPVTGLFTLTASFKHPRFDHTATILEDGTVLVAGGNSKDLGSDAELYDPVTAKFSDTGQLNQRRYDHTATRLKDGRVLIVGGFADNNSALSSAEIYIP